MSRVPCFVPFCRRSRKADPNWPHMEWICGKHWQMVSRQTKRRRRLADRAADRADLRFQQQYDQQGGCTERQLDRALAAKDLSNKLWKRCKREAIERAGGIS